MIPVAVAVVSDGDLLQQLNGGNNKQADTNPRGHLGQPNITMPVAALLPPLVLHLCSAFPPLTAVATNRLEARLAELDGLVSDPKLYDDSTKAGKMVRERAKVESKLENVKSLDSELQSWREMYGKPTLLDTHGGHLKSTIPCQRCRACGDYVSPPTM